MFKQSPFTRRGDRCKHHFNKNFLHPPTHEIKCWFWSLFFFFAICYCFGPSWLILNIQQIVLFLPGLMGFSPRGTQGENPRKNVEEFRRFLFSRMDLGPFKGCSCKLAQSCVFIFFSWIFNFKFLEIFRELNFVQIIMYEFFLCLCKESELNLMLYVPKLFSFLSKQERLMLPSHKKLSRHESS